MLYDMLERIAPSPAVTLNRAVAVAMSLGPEHGLAVLDPLLENPTMQRHHRTHAVHAHLLEMLGQRAAAADGYQRAAQLTTSLPEQRYLDAQALRLATAQLRPEKGRPNPVRADGAALLAVSWLNLRHPADVAPPRRVYVDLTHSAATSRVPAIARTGPHRKRTICRTEARPGGVPANAAQGRLPGPRPGDVPSVLPPSPVLVGWPLKRFAWVDSSRVVGSASRCRTSSSLRRNRNDCHRPVALRRIGW